MSDLPSISDLLKKRTETKKTGKEAATPLSQFEEKMHDVRIKEKESEAQREARELGVPYINLKGFPVAPEALSQLPRELSQKLQTVCFYYAGEELRLGGVHPTNEAVKELLYQLEERNKVHAALYKISEESLRIASKLYDALPQIKTIVKGVKITDDDLQRFQSSLTSFKDLQMLLNGASISDVMTIVMAGALHFETSDVHIEAEEHKVAIRFRMDGVLQEVSFLPHEQWQKIIARIKLISGLKINVIDRPQDGRFTIFLKTGDTDVRVSTIPTNWGESVVMRILKPSAIAVEFEALGWRPLVSKKLHAELDKPHGMILTTGPTGSGKTTTLYAMLRKLNTSDEKIITLEDPIEYKLEGINQSQIDHSKQYTFANGLRSILRQDPDVVMVGEIRDLETADVAINAALTGHLMLSTIHTNDAAGAIPRFIAMGVKPFLLSPALNAVIGQRLTRRIHDACKEPVTLDAETMRRVTTILQAVPPASGEVVATPDKWVFYRGKGCDICNHTGYKGRVGIYELLLMTNEIRAALSESLSEYQVRELAKQQGMTTMQQDGMLKALDGLTSVDEVLRVAGEGA